MEGAAVMIAELCANKLITPFFGTSIQVWAATLGITLLGLAGGYFLGSFLAKESNNSVKYLKNCLLLASIFLICASVLANSVSSLMLNLPLELGATLSLAVLLLPSLLALGSCSSLFINILNTMDKTSAGNSSGKIYGLSTIGGVLSTFMAGFLFIPELGVRPTLIGTALLLALATVILLRNNGRINVISCILILCFAAFGFTNSPAYNPKFDVLYEQDGILGNIKVIEHTSEDFSNNPKLGRGLVVNNTLQTYMDVNGPGISLWEWAHIIPTIAGVKPEGSKDLLIGMGGGTVYKQLQLINHSVDVIEIDKHIYDVCEEYFGVEKQDNFFITDGRHYLKTTEASYDIIIYDAFLSESPPEHLLTKEGLSDAVSCLNADGLLIINFFGFLQGDNGYAARSIAKTLQSLGLQFHLIPTPGKEEYRNLIFVVSNGRLPNYAQSTYVEPDRTPIRNWDKGVIHSKAVNTFDAEVLSDKKPKLAKLYQGPAKSWRRGYNEIYTKKLYKK